MMYPLLSILMTSYNRQQYIGEAIESILASTYTDWELIIVDDCSKDQTVAIAESYAAKDSRIRVYVNQQNLGDYKNRNMAASYAQGEYIMYVDSDDKTLTDGFENCISAMKQFPEIGIGIQYNNSGSYPFSMNRDSVILEHFFKQPLLMIGPGGTILRRSFFESIGRYPAKYGPANDLYFNLKAASFNGVVFLPFSFNYYRIHEGQEINNKFSYLYNQFNYLRDALKELDLPLTKHQKEWLQNKNRRRFFVNIYHHFIKTKSLKEILEARRRAKFGWVDLYRAFFHPSL